MKASPAASRSTAPAPRTASEIRKFLPTARAVGWNWKYSRSARTAPARQASGHAVGRGHPGVGGEFEELAGAAGGQQHGIGAQCLAFLAASSAQPAMRPRRVPARTRGRRVQQQFRAQRQFPRS